MPRCAEDYFPRLVSPPSRSCGVIMERHTLAVFVLNSISAA
jgi:hypothetical protein